MTLFYILIAVWIIMLIWIYKGAPEGYEDESGFHYGRPGDKKEKEK